MNIIDEMLYNENWRALCIVLTIIALLYCWSIKLALPFTHRVVELAASTGRSVMWLLFVRNYIIGTVLCAVIEEVVFYVSDSRIFLTTIFALMHLFTYTALLVYIKIIRGKV